MVSGGEDQVRHPACLRLPPLPTVLRSYGPTAYGPTVPTVPDQPSVLLRRRSGGYHPYSYGLRRRRVVGHLRCTEGQ